MRFLPLRSVPLVLACVLSAAPALAGPKYGPNAQPLSRRTNINYFQRNPAPDFWSLMPYYLPQPTGRACSAANLTLVLNGARSSRDLKSDDKLLTIVDFVKNYTDEAYEKAVLGDGPMERGNVTNKNMARLLNLAVEKLKIKEKGTLATVVDLDTENEAKGRKAFVAALKENEKSADDYIFISFVQGVLTGDPEGGAHVATIGAFDEKRGLVLIMDPDREWYEPYWAPVDKVYDSIKDPRSDGIHPGWVHFKVR